MTSREEFGPPDAADLMLAIGTAYELRGALVVALRLLLSGIPRDAAIATLQALLIDLKSRGKDS